MTAIGRIVGSLFGGPKVKPPSPVGPTPNIGDAGGEAAARLRASRMKRKTGYEDSILSGTLGTSGASPRPVKSILG